MSTGKSAIAAAVLGLTAALGGVGARAELLYFRDGGRVQATAILENGKVRVETPVGRFVFPSDAFVNVVPGFNPSRDWDVRRARAINGSAEERVSAAWWALENGLIEGSVELIRSARGLPAADPVVNSLNATLDRLELDLPPRETRPLAEALGVPLRTSAGPLVVLLHQHDDPAARAQHAHLERVVRAFYLWFAFHGVELKAPETALVFVQLRSRDVYLRFLRSQNAGAFSGTQGYFHPTYRAVVAYDLPPRSGGRGSIWDPVPESEADVKSGDSSSRRRLLSECDRVAQQLGTASHEMVHLLVTESGLDADLTRFPLWLHEGLAAQFEVVRGGRWAGVGRAHDIRLGDWREISPPPGLAPLVRDAGFGQGYKSHVYAASWGLVNYLSTRKPREFVTFLDYLRAPEPSPGLDRPDRTLACFRRAFGDDLGALEASWHDHITSLETPLQSRDPARTPQISVRRD